jgi:hypothetical protein
MSKTDSKVKQLRHALLDAFGSLTVARRILKECGLKSLDEHLRDIQSKIGKAYPVVGE